MAAFRLRPSPLCLTAAPVSRLCLFCFCIHPWSQPGSAAYSRPFQKFERKAWRRSAADGVNFLCHSSCLSCRKSVGEATQAKQGHSRPAAAVALDAATYSYSSYCSSTVQGIYSQRHDDAAALVTQMFAVNNNKQKWQVLAIITGSSNTINDWISQSFWYWCTSSGLTDAPSANTGRTTAKALSVATTRPHPVLEASA